MKAVIDFDMIAFHCSAACEKRSVHIVHEPTGKEWTVKNRTEFFGYWSRKGEDAKCILYKENQERDEPYLVDDFICTDIQDPEPIKNLYRTITENLNTTLQLAKADSYMGYIGKGKSQRLAQSTLKEYKGNRGASLIPVHLQQAKLYIEKKLGGEVVTDKEADDYVVMACYDKENRTSRKDRFCIIEDKDYWGCPIQVFDVNQMQRGIVDCNQFGKLYIQKKTNEDGKVTDKVRGEGRLFFYWQVLYGDDIDNYKANCFSDKRWGEKSAYNALVDCKNDKEAFKVIVEQYKKMYPEPKDITGWRGDTINIDWFYVMSEMFTMARMLRFHDDIVDLKDILVKYKLLES